MAAIVLAGAADDGVAGGCASVPAVVATGGVLSVRAARPTFAVCSAGGGCGAAMVGLAVGSAVGGCLAASGCGPVEDAGVVAARAAVADAAAGAGWWVGCFWAVAVVGAVGAGRCCAVVDGSVGFSCAAGATADGASNGTAAWWCAATVGGGAVFFRFPGVSCTAGSSVGGVGADGVSLGVGCASALAVVVADGSQSVRAAHPTFAAYSSVGVGDEAAALVVGFFGAGCAFVLAVGGAEGVVAGGGWSPAVGGTRARLLFFRPLIITREL